MTIQFSLGTILLLVGIVIGIFTGCVLLFTLANKIANRYLASLVFICVGPLLHNFLLESGIYEQFPDLYFLPVILSLGIGPLLYLYVNRLIDLHPTSNRNIALHLLPVVVQFLVYGFCFVQTSETKYFIWKDYYEPIIKPILVLLVYLSVAWYLYLSFKEIAYYKLQLNYFYSNTEKIALSWLRKLLYVFMTYYALSIFFTILSSLFKIETNYFPSDLIRCIIIFIIAVFAIRQNSLVNIQHNLSDLSENQEEKLKSFAENNLLVAHEPKQENLSASPLEASSSQSLEKEESKPKEINRVLLQKIIDTVEKEQLFLNADLTIADVAEKMGFSSKTISHTINNGTNKSFSKFINQFRVNLFKEKLASGKYEYLSILGLAFECGFNSKSSFNRIFKEVTGSSPKEFRL
jgi:AraC-like DNA-binding protein